MASVVVAYRQAISAGVTVLVCEMCQTFRFEVRHFWSNFFTSMPFKKRCIHLLYFHMRYASIPFLLIGLHFLSVLSNGGLNRRFCGFLYVYQAYSFQSFMTAVEIILAFRVYATFNHNKLIALLLAIVVSFDTIFNIIVPLTSNLHAIYTPNCVVTNNPRELRWLTFVLFESQAAFALLEGIGIYLLYKEHSRKGLAKTVIPILLLEHLVTFFALLLYLILAVVFFKKVVYIGYYVLMTLVPALGCRLVIHLYGFRDGDFQEESMEVGGELTRDEGATVRRRRSQNVRFTSVANDIELASYTDTEMLGASCTGGASSSRGDESTMHD